MGIYYKVVVGQPKHSGNIGSIYIGQSVGSSSNHYTDRMVAEAQAINYTNSSWNYEVKAYDSETNKEIKCEICPACGKIHGE